MTRWAVFDVDGTLLPNTSMEKMFLKHLIRQKILPIRNLMYFMLNSTKYLLRGDTEKAFPKNKAYLKNLPVQTIEKDATRFFNQKIAPSLSPTGLQRFESLRANGHKTMVMSGSVYFLTELLSSVCGADYAISTQLQQHDGKFSGRINGLHPLGIAKRTLLLEISEKLDIDFQESIVFANNEADIYHMELFANPTAVNPTPKLKKMAKERGWGIEYWGKG